MTAASQPDDIRLVSLVSAKLCHDLVGPLSALNMITESLEDEDPEMVATSRAMILESAAKAINRLSFFRAAIGRGQALGSSEARGLIEKVLAEGKVTTKWEDSLSAQTTAAGPLLLRLALNLAYLAGHAVIGGGAVGVKLGGSEATPSMLISAAGKRINFEESSRLALIAGAAADLAAIGSLDPRSAYAYYAGRMAAGLGLGLKVSPLEPAGLEIRVDRA